MDLAVYDVSPLFPIMFLSMVWKLRRLIQVEGFVKEIPFPRTYLFYMQKGFLPNVRKLWMLVLFQDARSVEVP